MSFFVVFFTFDYFHIYIYNLVMPIDEQLYNIYEDLCQLRLHKLTVEKFIDKYKILFFSLNIHDYIELISILEGLNG